MAEFWEWREAPKADFAVVGDPVSHSLSPRMHTAAYDALGLALRYVAVRVPPVEFSDAMDHLGGKGYRGVNVTVPLKREALEWAQSADDISIRAQAANTLNLSDRTAINTDAPGFLDTLSELKLTRKSALILGAGGSARAIVLALAGSGFDVRIWNRTHQRAVELAKEAGAVALEHPAPGDADLVVNCTSVSLAGGGDLPLEWDQVLRDAAAVDLMYSAQPTAFLQSAQRRGLRTVDGRTLLVAQGALSFEWWLGMSAPREAMAAAIE